jgi:hypothetical protein
MIDAAAMAAVSMRRIRGPRVTDWYPAFLMTDISSSESRLQVLPAERSWLYPASSRAPVSNSIDVPAH